MKKIIITLAIMFMVPVTVFAANIDLNVDKTNLSMDDVAHISISINGSVDSGQVGVTGLDNFEIIGQQSSQSIQMINGQTSQVQKKEITVKPKKSGSFTIIALAKDGGEEINSQSVTINVQKSQLEEAKDELLKDNSKNSLQDTNQSNTIKDNLDDVLKNQEPKSDFDTDLLKESQTSQPQKTDANQQDNQNELQTKQIKNFPKVEHISEFNTIFWVEFVGILVAITLITIATIFAIKKYKK